MVECPGYCAMNDFRFAFRTLRQNPGFALTAIVSIGLAVGAGSTVFAVYDAVLFRPLPVPGASQVLTLCSRSPSGSFGDVSYADFSDFRRLDHSFSALFASRINSFAFAKDTKEQPRMKAGLLASGNIFEALDIKPALGRTFRPDEDQALGRDAVTVLGFEFWRDEFESDRNIAGRRILLNGVSFTIIGVTPESFTGIDQFFHPALYVPTAMASALAKADSDLLSDRANRAFTVKGRIKPGVSLQTASGEALALANSLAQSFPTTNQGFGAGVRTELETRVYHGGSDIQGDGILAILLFCLVGVVLLIACANVANLILGRGRARSRELAVRLAIGASRGRLVRALLAECALIALGGAMLGLGVAQAGVELTSGITLPGDVPLDLAIQLDDRVLLFTLAVSLGSVLLFGLVPAITLTRGDLVPALKAGELDPARRRFFGRNALVIVQVAGSLLLMVMTTQLFRGASYVLSHNPGFRVENRLLMTFNPAIIGYTPEHTAAFYKELLAKVRTVPGVKSVALAHFIPTSTSYEGETLSPEGYQFPAGQQGAAMLAATVDENYFSTIGTPIVAGRGFLPTDDANAPLVVVVNQFFVAHYNLKNPIGKRVKLGGKKPRFAQIVGVAAMAKYSSVIEPPMDFVYRPMRQQPSQSMTLITETRSDPSSYAEPLRRAVHTIAPSLPVWGVRTFEDLYYQRSVKVVNILMTVVAAIGMVGLGLALVGLYAVVAYQVSRRTREIGIRMAIGASKSQVMKMVLRQAALLSVSGTGVGFLLSLVVGQGLKAGLGVPHFDLPLFALTVITLLTVTTMAALIPAHRAAVIDPMFAMRQD
jgi:predicted permease